MLDGRDCLVYTYICEGCGRRYGNMEFVGSSNDDDDGANGVLLVVVAYYMVSCGCCGMVPVWLIQRESHNTQAKIKFKSRYRSSVLRFIKNCLGEAGPLKIFLGNPQY